MKNVKKSKKTKLKPESFHIDCEMSVMKEIIIIKLAYLQPISREISKIFQQLLW